MDAIMFGRIKREYEDFESRLKAEGKGLVFTTKKGIYGTTPLNQIFKFFKDIHLEKFRHFLDLGCGDGRVVLVASLFTKATGIEFSKELVDEGILIRDKLGMDTETCELIQGDYLTHNIEKYDIVFMNPDHEFHELDDKLKQQLNGPLFIYNDIFAPNTLKKGKKHWPGPMPIITYTKE